jgi:hypothetical protein
MTRAFIGGCLSALVIGLGAAPVAAQAQQGAKSESPPSQERQQQQGEVKERPATGLAMKAAKAFSQPLHPVLKGVASSGGIGGGVGYDFPSAGDWKTSAEAVATIYGYWSTGITSTHETPRTRLTAYGRVRDMNALSFFGPGTDSVAGDRTLFGLRDPVLGVVGSVRLLPWVTAGARAEEIWPEVNAPGSTRFPRIDARFGEASAPGLADQPRFGRYQGYVDLIADAGPAGALYQGGKTRIGYALYDDQQFDRYDFRRVDVETKHRFTVFGPHRLLTLHGWVSTTDAGEGKDVPFYFQNTLGGKGHIRSVDEPLLGTDGTDATLRGFRTFRFRDRHVLLLQAEYRIPVWGPIDATVFVDAGKVAPRLGELDFSDLKRSYGFSLGAVSGSDTVFRVDVGFGGGEGTHVFFTIGKVM